MIKKLLLECIVVFSIGFTIGWFGWKPPVHQPPKEFTIYQSLIIGSANYDTRNEGLTYAKATH